MHKILKAKISLYCLKENTKKVIEAGLLQKILKLSLIRQ